MPPQLCWAAIGPSPCEMVQDRMTTATIPILLFPSGDTLRPESPTSTWRNLAISCCSLNLQVQTSLSPQAHAKNTNTGLYIINLKNIHKQNYFEGNLGITKDHLLGNRALNRNHFRGNLGSPKIIFGATWHRTRIILEATWDHQRQLFVQSGTKQESFL